MWRRPSFLAGVVAVAAVAAIAATTAVLPVGEELPTDPSAAIEGKGADPVVWAEENYDAAIGLIEQDAVDWATLIAAIVADPEAAGVEYGQREEGAKDFSYAVRVTGTLSESDFGQLAIDADGTPSGVRVGFQVGPAITGAAFRDATGLATFGLFTNQTDYQKAGTELNNMIKERVLAGFDAEQALGKRYTITGAFTWDPAKPQAVLTPVGIEETS
ncbi:MAG: DUF2291 domain-containing protein [Bifidobacteriaceae bacterium]|nr:DUF2291 domain-containing protein [Bifidobacteriaceae bacterium]